MDIYLLFKLLHVLSAVVWVGGGLCLMVLGVFANSRNDDAEVLRVVQSVAFMGNRWFMPASLLTVIFGAIATYLGPGFGELWILLGLAGFAAAFVTGTFVFKPQSEKLVAQVAEGQTSEAMAIARGLLNVAKFDYVVMFLVIADMVLKPTIRDLPVLGIMAVVLAAGVWVLVSGLRKSDPVAA
jgi:uncharacterized membrane protein